MVVSGQLENGVGECAAGWDDTGWRSLIVWSACIEEKMDECAEKSVKSY